MPWTIRERKVRVPNNARHASRARRFTTYVDVDRIDSWIVFHVEVLVLARWCRFLLHPTAHLARNVVVRDVPVRRPQADVR